MTTADDAQAARWARREPLLHLLGRLDRGVLLTAEHGLLRAAVETELADGDQAHEAFGNVMQQRDADSKSTTAAMAERRRDLAAALDTVDNGTWHFLIRRAEQITAGRRTWRKRAEDIETDRDQLARRLDTVRKTRDEATAALDAHQLAIAAALGCPADTPWPDLIRGIRTAASLARDSFGDDRHLNAWRSARKRAATMTAEVTRRAPLLGQYAERTTAAEAALARVRAVPESWERMPADRYVYIHEAARTVREALDGDQPTAEQPAEHHWAVFGRCAGCGHATIRIDTNGRFLCQRCEDRGEIPEHEQPAERPTVADLATADGQLHAAVRAYMSVAAPLVTHLARVLGVTPPDGTG